MDYDIVRASRRPMPRQMDVSDWNIDADVRSGVSSSVSYQQPQRSAGGAFDGCVQGNNRRLSSGDEFRTHVDNNVLRPVNRYDSGASMHDSHRRRDDHVASASSSWRTSAEVGQATIARRSNERETGGGLSMPPLRTQPRAMPDSRRSEDAYVRRESNRDGPRSSSMMRGSEESDYSNHGSRIRPLATAENGGQPSRFLADVTPSSSVFLSPPRQQIRQAVTPITVGSDASTVLSSTAYTPSITDTPSTTTSSSELDPSSPYTPLSNYRSARRLTMDTPSPPQYHRPSSPVSNISTTTPPPRLEPSHGSSSTSPHTDSSTTGSHRHVAITPQQQRQQLYDFRRDIRQVFARVDEMVDLHRDLFKSDALSGMPEFNTNQASETEAFANDTFQQLTALREKFQEMTTAWKQQREQEQQEVDPVPAPRSGGGEYKVDEEDDGNSSIASDDAVVMRAIASHRHRREEDDVDSVAEEASLNIDSIESLAPPSSSEASTPDRSERQDVRSRWESSLASLSRKCSSPPPPSSPSSVSTSSEPSPVPSDFPTRSSRAAMPKDNIFDDFDKRMEEIRASLNALARDKPQPLLQTMPKDQLNHSEPRSATLERRETTENDPRTSNQRQQHASGGPDRNDREARLRQLLKELRETGDD